MQKAIFLDRDGILNEDKGYMYKVEEFKLVDGIIELLNHLKNKGYIFVVITNQGGIEKKLYTEEQMNLFNFYLIHVFKKEGITFEKIFYCPHHDVISPCNCRKPSPKMWQMAKVEFDIDMLKSWTIGDKITDCKGGKSAGTKTILLKSRYNEIKPNDDSVDYFVNSLKDIVNIINK